MSEKYSFYDRLIPWIHRHRDPDGAVKAIVDGFQEQSEIDRELILNLPSLQDMDAIPLFSPITTRVMTFDNSTPGQTVISVRENLNIPSKAPLPLNFMIPGIMKDGKLTFSTGAYAGKSYRIIDNGKFSVTVEGNLPNIRTAFETTVYQIQGTSPQTYIVMGIRLSGITPIDGEYIGLQFKFLTGTLAGNTYTVSDNRELSPGVYVAVIRGGSELTGVSPGDSIQIGTDGASVHSIAYSDSNSAYIQHLYIKSAFASTLYLNGILEYLSGSLEGEVFSIIKPVVTPPTPVPAPPAIYKRFTIEGGLGLYNAQVGDQVRVYGDTLTISGNCEYLAYLANHVGLKTEACDPCDLRREQIRAAVPIYRIKGTIVCYEALMRTLGFSAKVVPLFEDSPDSLFTKDEDEIIPTPPSPLPPGYDLNQRLQPDSKEWHASSRVRLELEKLDAAEDLALCGLEEGTLSQFLLTRILEKVRSVTPIHIDILVVIVTEWDDWMGNYSEQDYIDGLERLGLNDYFHDCKEAIHAVEAPGTGTYYSPETAAALSYLDGVECQPVIALTHHDTLFMGCCCYHGKGVVVINPVFAYRYDTGIIYDDDPIARYDVYSSYSLYPIYDSPYAFYDAVYAEHLAWYPEYIYDSGTPRLHGYFCTRGEENGLNLTRYGWIKYDSIDFGTKLVTDGTDIVVCVGALFVDLELVEEGDWIEVLAYYFRIVEVIDNETLRIHRAFPGLAPLPPSGNFDFKVHWIDSWHRRLGSHKDPTDPSTPTYHHKIIPSPQVYYDVPGFTYDSGLFYDLVGMLHDCCGYEVLDYQMRALQHFWRIGDRPDGSENLRV